MDRGVLRTRAIRGGHNRISFSTFMSATFIPKSGMEPVGSSHVKDELARKVKNSITERSAKNTGRTSSNSET